MRSRTEARWAAFMDELNWDWEYEPFDLNGYIPDFALNLRFGQTIIEIKGSVEDVTLAKSKLECSGWSREALIVSRKPGVLYGPVWCVADLMTQDPSGDVFRWNKAILHTCLACGDVTYVADCGSWMCRMCGHNDGDNHLGPFSPEKAWAAASNRVQWRAPE